MKTTIFFLLFLGSLNLCSSTNHAYKLYVKGDLKGALQQYSLEPITLETLNNLCTIHYLLGNYKKAEKMCLKGLTIDDSLYIPHFNLGLIYEKEQDYKKAIISFRQALKIKNDHSLSWFHLGNIFHQQKNCKEAISMYQKAIILDETLGDAYYNLAISYVQCQKLERGIENYQLALKHLKKNKADAYYNLANIYRSKKEYYKAVENYQLALAENKLHINSYNNLGITYSALGDIEKAILTFKKGLEIDPLNHEILHNLALDHNHTHHHHHHQHEHENDSDILKNILRPLGENKGCY